MRILVYGAGNIGSLYAALLHESGQEVSILVRGKRADEIRQQGIRIEAFDGGEQITARVKIVERLDPEDDFDLVLVVLPKNHVSEVLPSLAASRHTPSVMFFGNNAAGPGAMIEALGRNRVLLGFPGAAAVRGDDRLRYLILSAREQPTTIGEIDGSRSPRLTAIRQVFSAAGFPVAVCSNMDAWLKTHAVEIVATACALYMVAGDPHRLAQTPDALRLMVRAIREGYRVLHENGIPITPAIHRIVQWLPESILISLAKRMLGGDKTSIKIGHARNARDELKVIAEEIRSLARNTLVSTPAMDRLYEYL